MYVAHGIDITSWERKEFTNPKLPIKILHQFELDFYNKITDQKQAQKFLASRWAIKEAIIKAENNKIAMNTINVEYFNNKPFVILCDNKYDISISYENDLIIASAICLKEE